MLNISLPTLWRWGKDDETFPRKIKLGPNMVGYLTSQIEEWLSSNIFDDKEKARDSLASALNNTLIKKSKSSDCCDVPECLKRARGITTLYTDAIAPGIYLLFFKEEIVYIGQSVNPYARIGQHISEKGLFFDKAYFIPVPKADMLYVEQVFIRTLQPKLNVTVTHDYLDGDEKILKKYGIDALAYNQRVKKEQLCQSSQ